VKTFFKLTFLHYLGDKMKQALILLFFTLLGWQTFAQNKKVLDSLHLAYQKAQHDTSRILTLNAIAYQYRNSQLDTCLFLSEKALQMSEKIDFEKGKAQAYYRIGYLNIIQGNNTEALKYYQKALPIFEKIKDKRHIAGTLNNTGVIYKNLENYPPALEYLQKSLKINEEMGNKQDIANCLMTIGMIYYKQGNFLSSLEYYQKSLKISEEIGFKRGIADNLINIGNTYNDQGNYPLALEYYQKSLKMNQEIGHKQGISNNLTCIGTIYNSQGNYPLALESYQKSLKITEEIGDKQGIANNLGNIGLIYQNQGNYSKALEYYQKSLQKLEEIGDKSSASTILNNIGGVYNNQHNSSKALEYFQKSLSISEEIGNKQGIANGLGNIGDIYNQQGELAKALDYFQKSLKIKQEIGDKWSMIYSQNGLAQVYQKQGNYANSISYAQEGLRLAQELKTLAEVKLVSKTLFETNKLKGDYVKALEYFELYKSTNDSLFNVDKEKAIANLEAKAEIERKEKEIALLNKNKELDKKEKEALEKDLKLQKIETERQQIAKLAIEKQAEADRFLALARQEKDQRKQDSLYNLAEKAQLVSENLKTKQGQLEAESKARQLEILKEKEEIAFQQKIIYTILGAFVLLAILSFITYRSKQQAVKARKEVEAINEEVLQQREEILQQNEEINQQKDVLALQTQELEQSNHTKDKLFAILGHDLRSPINSLEGMLNLINQGSISYDEFNLFAPKLHRNVKNMQSTLENLLQWSINQMQGLKANPSHISVTALINEKVQLFAEVAKAKNITLETHSNTEVFAWADTDHVRLILRNLINNALKFTPKAGKITISNQSQADKVIVHITDTGVGMSAEQIEKLFKKNQNFTTYGTGGEKGTGLGLQLCQEIIAKNEGEIWASSEIGNGSTFSFSLPPSVKEVKV
jgi:signal transduction histidine kinase